MGSRIFRPGHGKKRQYANNGNKQEYDERELIVLNRKICNLHGQGLFDNFNN
jgi:hypothetical protein